MQRLAKLTGRHRNVVRRWMRTREFQEEALRQLREKVTSTTIRQVHRSGTIAEALFQLAAKHLADGLQAGKLDVGQARLAFEELLAWQKEELAAVEVLALPAFKPLRQDRARTGDRQSGSSNLREP